MLPHRRERGSRDGERASRREGEIKGERGERGLHSREWGDREIQGERERGKIGQFSDGER